MGIVISTCPHTGFQLLFHNIYQLLSQYIINWAICDRADRAGTLVLCSFPVNQDKVKITKKLSHSCKCPPNFKFFFFFFLWSAYFLHNYIHYTCLIWRIDLMPLLEIVIPQTTRLTLELTDWFLLLLLF